MEGEGARSRNQHSEELEDAQGQVELPHHFEKLQAHSASLPWLPQGQDGVLP